MYMLCELIGKEYHYVDIIEIFVKDKTLKEKNEVLVTFFSMHTPCSPLSYTNWDLKYEYDLDGQNLKQGQNFPTNILQI